MTTKILMAALVASVGFSTFAAEELKVTINPSVEKGPIRIMNAVNNGPTKPRKDQSRGNFEEYAALKIPYGRVHDANHCYAYGGPHTVDISAIFPNFDADETKPESYDFTHTDAYLETMIAAGTEPFFRLGESIEHAIKKYHTHPPKDFAKWARVCEHIIRHYNEGWGNGFKWNIKHWEIWNEPTLRTGPNSPCWSGTKEQYFELYKTTSLHLRNCFGDTIKIGGPASHVWMLWLEDFVKFCATEKLPLDFYSWHSYPRDAREPSEASKRVREMLDKYGYTKTFLCLNEWNYVKGWSDDWVYTLECETGRLSQKGAAFIAGVMIATQDSPLDMLMFYDARIGCGMNNMFDKTSYRPSKGYYPFLAWRRLRELGTQVEAKIEKNTADKQLFAVAAKNKNGKMGIFLARYQDDNNVTDTRLVTISLPKNMKVNWDNARCYVTDVTMTHTETPLIANEDGSASVKMMPDSFAFIEF